MTVVYFIDSFDNSKEITIISDDCKNYKNIR